MNSIKTYIDLPIWKILKSRFAEEPLTIDTERSLQDIIKILDFSATGPQSFTLHDAAHSTRVAARMSEIIPIETMQAMGCTELCLLILSAYLHDIGMTPAQGIVTKHYNYLFGIKHDELEPISLSDKQLFDHWLDENPYGLALPITLNAPAAEDHHLILDLLASYCRERHNDWSKDWIRAHLAQFDNRYYPLFTEHLITICQSHHQGREQLLTSRFDPYLTPKTSEIVHIRYAACVLRIADILEFSPERTPRIIFKHRLVTASSKIYWEKDHHTALVLDENTYSLAAKAPNHIIHKAIEGMGNDIRKELETCAAIANTAPFNYSKLTPRKVLPHKWKLEPTINVDVTPHDNSYEYIDGTLQPNAHKLLRLISGSHLYRSNIDPIRELAQNAFDAIEEQIAYIQTQDSYIYSTENDLNTRNQHQIKLSIDTRPDGLHLICTDMGVGMSKKIITNHILKSGNSNKTHTLQLKRSCISKGIPFRRTGQFGIGLLSYFMIAKSVAITTCRSRHTRDYEPNGWKFEIDGLESFASLKQSNDLISGTKVELALKQSMPKSADILFNDIKNYFDYRIKYSGSELIIKDLSNPSNLFTIPAGWRIIDDEEFLGDMFQTWKSKEQEIHPDIAPKQLSEDLKNEASIQQKTIYEAKQRIRYIQKTGNLNNCKGQYRIIVPYFELDGGKSIPFLCAKATGRKIEVVRIKEAHMYTPRSKVQFSWKGMQADSGYRKTNVNADAPPPCLISIDLQCDSLASISADRANLSISEAGHKAISDIFVEAQTMVREFLKSIEDSPYSTISHLVCGAPHPQHPPIWIKDLSPTSSLLIPLNALYTHIPPWWVRPPELEYKVKGLTPIPLGAITEYNSRLRGRTYKFFDTKLQPTKLVHYSLNSYLTILPIWDFRSPSKSISNTYYNAPFEPHSALIAGCRSDSLNDSIDNEPVYNTNHTLVQSISNADQVGLLEIIGPSRSPLLYASDLLKSPKLCAAWILRHITTDPHLVWKGMLENQQPLLQKIWDTAFQNQKSPTHISFLYLDMPTNTLTLFSPHSVVTISGKGQIREFINASSEKSFTANTQKKQRRITKKRTAQK